MNSLTPKTNNLTITQRENALFDEWRAYRANLVSDGVVSIQDYLNSDLKLCFILKEANDPSGDGGWDLRAFIRNEDRGATWDNVARWVTCIRNINHEVAWQNIKNMTHEIQKEILRSICAFNLKKTPGLHTTNAKTFTQQVSEDREFIKRQYAIYTPDLTICCGTGWHFKDVLGVKDQNISETSRGIKWFLNNENKPVLMFSHPEARVHVPLIIYGLVDAVKEVLQQSNRGII